MQKHSYNIFPEMSEEDYSRLVNDIKQNGFDESQPIWLYQDAILDGWNRHRACLECNVTPKFKTFAGDDSEAIAFVMRTNKRRNLSSSQWAAIAVEAKDIVDAIATIVERERREKQAETQKETHAGLLGNKLPDSHPDKNKTTAKVADMFNTNRTYVAQAEKIKQAAPDVFKAIKSGETTIAKANREIARQETEKRIAKAEATERPTNKPAEVVLADPPWRYDFSETKSREIENQYPTATLEEICSHAPPMADNCVVFLWATVAKLQEAFSVVSAWGLKYKTCAVWDKERVGMGYWFRGQHELLLVCTKGNPETPPENRRVSSVFREARTSHSKKPQCVYEWIESAFPGKALLEMYCRSPRDGWMVWGNEV